MSDLLTSKFVSEYGSYANDYEYVSPSGSLSTSNQLILILGIVLLVVGLVLTGVSVPPKSKTNPGKRQESSVN